MAAPVGFIPDNAPEGFLPEEPEAPKPVSAAEALGFATTAPQQITSALTRTLEAGAPGSEMGRQQAMFGRIPPAPTERAPTIPGTVPEGGVSPIQGIARVGGEALRTVGQVINPMTYLPEEEVPKPFIISPEGIRQMTTRESRARSPLYTPDVPLLPVRGTQLEPTGSDAARQIASLSTLDNIALMATGAESQVVGLAMLADMAPQAYSAVRNIARSDIAPEEKRDQINALVMPLAIGLRHMKPESAETTVTPKPFPGIRTTELPPEQPMAGATVPITPTPTEVAPPVEAKVAVKNLDYGKRRVEKRIGDKWDDENRDDLAFSIVPAIDDISLESSRKLNPNVQPGEMVVVDIKRNGDLEVRRVKESPTPEVPTSKAIPSLEEAHKGAPPVPENQIAIRVRMPNGDIVPGVWSGYQEAPGFPKFDKKPYVATTHVEGKWSHGILPPGSEILDPIPTFEEWKAGSRTVPKAKETEPKPEQLGTKIKQAPTPERFESIEDLLKFRSQRRSEEISLYREQIGLTEEKAKQLQQLLADNRSTQKFESKLSEDERQKLNAFFEGPLNQRTSTFEMWDFDKNYNPEELVGEEDTKYLSSALFSALADRFEASPTSDKFIYAAVAARKLKQLGVTQPDLARLLQEHSQRAGGNIEYFKIIAERLRDFLGSQGITFGEAVKPKPTAEIPTATETTPPIKGERLTAAAYKTPEGTIETGAHHPAILRRLGIPGFETRESRNTPQFGYVTTHRPFVPRGQLSADIAKISGQKLEPFDVDPMTGQEMPHSNEIESTTETGKAISETKPPVPKTIPAKSETINPNPPVEVDSPTAEIGSGGETGVEMARHGTTSGLPPSVPDRGPGFSGELLEASRQLGTLVRSRVTLPKNVLGQYVRARSAIGQMDRIEVGDIRNQLTVSHEMGHDLDALIWDKINLSRSQRSLEERVPGTSGKDLQKELIPISELMRGPITGTRGHQAYRKSATELIADFFALYAHDPEKARAMAPKFSEGFENALAKKPDAAGVINQLLEGNVEPVPAEQAYKGPAVSPVQTPGKILSRLMPDPVKRDFPAAVAAQDLVKGTVREFESRVQRARVVADKWREQVPNKAERNDVGAFVEGIGNIEIPGDTIDAVVSRMTPAMRDFAKKYRFAIEAQRNDINAYLKGAEEGEYLKFLEDYLAHFYANTGTATGRSGLSKFMKDSPNAKARKLPTNREAVEMGLIPITQDPSVLYEHHANINWRTATNRQLMQSLKDMRLSTGEPAVLPAKDAPPGWTITQNPLVQKVYARQTPGGVMIWKGGAAIHPDVWHAVRQILENPVSSDLAKGFDALNGLTRANAFAFSLFHDITLRSAAVGEMAGVNPLRGLFRLFERNPTTGEIEAFRSTRGLGKELLKDEEAVADAAKNGLKFSWTESESYQRNARDFLEKMAAKWREVPYLGKTAALARDIQHMRQEGLWKNTHDAFKIIAYNDAVSKALSDAPKGTNVDAVKQQIASRLNDAFGGQEWQTKFWMSPQIRRAMSRFFLAPDWTLSTLRSVPFVSDAASVVRTQAPRLVGREPGLANFEGVGGNLGRARFWAGELAALASATIATQYAVYAAMGDPRKGDQPWVWDNETGQKRRIDITPIIRNLPWHDEKDRTRYYVNLGKRPEEILSWFIHPEVNIQSKMSRPVAEIYHQISGMEGDFKEPWKQDHETFVESVPKRAVSISKEFVPFVFAGNQFALSVPYRKGMTKSKAQNAYESAYELAAEPSRLRSLMRGQQPSEGSLTQMVSEVTDAAIRNGVPAEQIRKRALSTVRGHHYNLYFKALQANDKPAMEKEAIALQRLGATGQGLERSIQIRSQ